MKWCKVEDSLPNDGKIVLALVSSFFSIDAIDPLGQKRSCHIFEAVFTRSRGWHIFFMPNDRYEVISWMDIPIEKPQEDKC